MKKIFSTLLVLAVIALPSLAGAAGTIVVSGNTAAGENQPGWMFNRDTNTDTPFTFNTDAASVGAGSLYVLPIGANASDKFIAENFINTPIANVNSISYDFKIAGDGLDTDEEHFYMNVYANFGVSDDLKFYDCRYNVVPTVGSTAGFTTVTFDPTQAYPVTTRNTSPHTCPSIPADMDALSAGSNIRAIALNVGDTSTNDEGLGGYLDNVVFNLDSDGMTTFDFEPIDIDNDGVPNAQDLCPATEADSPWNESWGTNRLQVALSTTTDGLVWIQNQPVKKGKGTQPIEVHDLAYTYGCNGHQILDMLEAELGDVMNGHRKYGLSSGLVDEFHLDLSDGVLDGMYLIDTITVPSQDADGVASTISLIDGESYIIKSSGTWTNRPGETVDTKYVTMDGWTTPTDAPDGGYPNELLELQVADSFVDWGTYSGTHEYELAYSPLVPGTVNFRVFDGDVGTNTPNPGWYGDNVGNLTVKIYAQI